VNAFPYVINIYINGPQACIDSLCNCPFDVEVGCENLCLISPLVLFTINLFLSIFRWLCIIGARLWINGLLVMKHVRAVAEKCGIHTSIKCKNDKLLCFYDFPSRWSTQAFVNSIKYFKSV